MSLFDVVYDLFLPRYKSRRYWIRARALKTIDDQEILQEMYKDEPPDGIQKNIISEIDDQEFLASIVEENGIYSACAAARLSTQQNCKLFIKHSNPHVRRIVVGKLDKKEQEIFKKIIESENDPEVRIIAVKRLAKNEQEILRSIAKSDENPPIRMVAIEKINDYKFLMTLLDNKTSRKVRKKLNLQINDLKIQDIEKITDQEELKRIIHNESSNAVKVAAIKNIDNQNILLEIIITNQNLGENVIKQITDEELLLSVALNESIDYSIREAAYKRLKTEKSQAIIAAKGGTWNFCFEAAGKVCSPKLIAMIFAEADPMIKSEIIPKIPKSKDKELYQKEDKYTRQAVIERTKDQNILEKAALEDTDTSIRQIAVLKITDSKIRRKIEMNSSDDVVKEIARLPLKGKCGTCGKQVRITDCETRNIMGDYSTMHFFHCRSCYNNDRGDLYSGRIEDHNGEDIMYSTPSGEWG